MKNSNEEEEDEEDVDICILDARGTPSKIPKTESCISLDEFPVEIVEMILIRLEPIAQFVCRLWRVVEAQQYEASGALYVGSRRHNTQSCAHSMGARDGL